MRGESGGRDARSQEQKADGIRDVERIDDGRPFRSWFQRGFAGQRYRAAQVLQVENAI